MSPKLYMELWTTYCKFISIKIYAALYVTYCSNMLIIDQRSLKHISFCTLYRFLSSSSFAV
uniref:Uncharacterized protein n=1 Tax=Manihot esculenta TaxID=3983 RepID=A0A199UAK3_MANES